MVAIVKRQPQQQDLERVVLVGLPVVIGLFQVALACGAPWGGAAYGGANEGVLPTNLRVASGASAAVWLGVGVALSRVNRVPTPSQRVWLRVLGAVSGVAATVNLLSQSPVERVLWVPVSLAMGFLALRAARKGSGGERISAAVADPAA